MSAQLTHPHPYPNSVTFLPLLGLCFSSLIANLGSPWYSRSKAVLGSIGCVSWYSLQAISECICINWNQSYQYTRFHGFKGRTWLVKSACGICGVGGISWTFAACWG
ncbi:hypothetical protein HDV57DRAFT_131266 [Trichoderma longibrachiatum]